MTRQEAFKPPLGYCGDCIWRTTVGNCRRMPPTRDMRVAVVDSGDFCLVPLWPTVGNLDWCGEFTPKAKPITAGTPAACGDTEDCRGACEGCPDAPPPSVRPAEEDLPSPTLGDCPAPAVRARRRDPVVWETQGLSPQPPARADKEPAPSIPAGRVPDGKEGNRG